LLIELSQVWFSAQSGVVIYLLFLTIRESLSTGRGQLHLLSQTFIISLVLPGFQGDGQVTARDNG
jgi:hypothetical protein